MIKNSIFIAIISLSFNFILNSQTKDLGQPLSFNSRFSLSKKSIEFPALDNKSLETFYKNKSKETGEKNLTYGFVHETDINFFEEAEKKKLSNGLNLYQLLLKSPNAVSINVIFKNFKLAEGSVMYLFSADKKSYIGAYTSLNNNIENVLGTDLVFSDQVYIEIQEPIQNEGLSKLKIEKVVHGFVNIDELFNKGLNDSGNCNIDVNCPQGAGWSIQRNAVAMLVNNSGGFCTGAMVNNTSGQLIPYFLTANHCGGSPANWVFRFRWEAPANQADCGTSTPSVNGPQNMNINGGITRARYSPSDFHLIELNSAPPNEWDVVYAGWQKSDIPASSGAGIHHPNGDIKKIAISTQAYISSSYFGTAAQNHWKAYWSEGVTEGGSSGSPLFNQNRRIVGQLHGGASGCSSEDQSDFYGKFSVSWEGGGTPESRLKDWLDPSETDIAFVDANKNFNLDPFFASPVLGIEKSACSGTYVPKVVLSNGGIQNLTSATITYILNGNPTPFEWTGNLGAFQTDTITFPELNLPAGEHTFAVWVTNPNNSVDEVMSNNLVSTTFFSIVDGYTFSMELNLDCYGSETTWDIKTNNDIEIHTGGKYTNNDNTPHTINKDVCLNEGCYKITLYDSYGDGMADNFCGTNGSFYFTNSLGDTLAQMLESEAAFGSKLTREFCVENYASLNKNKIDYNAIFPNPFQEIISIESNKEIIQIEISDLSGKIVFKKEVNLEENKYKIDIMPELNKGIYNLMIFNADLSKYTKKIIKI
jgi:lysyl endopeptidase